MNTVFLRVLEADDKATALLDAVRNPERARRRQWFDVDAASFAAVPGSPFAYWASARLRRLFKELPPFEADGRTAKQGLASADDFRFVRGWWATPPRRKGERWFPFAKGGKFSPFYADVYLVVNWHRGGEEIKSNLNERGGVRSNVWMLRDTAANFFLRPGLTWPVRARRFAPQVLDAGCIFSHRGYSCFLPEAEALACLGLFNSTTFDYLFKLTLGRFGYPEFLVGILPSIPMPLSLMAEETTLAALARRAWSMKRQLDTRAETSHAFTSPALLQVEGNTLAARASAWVEHVNTVDTEVATIQAEIDEHCFALYGIDEVDRRNISDGFGDDASGAQANGDASEPEDDAGEDDEENETAADAAALAADLVSWAVGVAFGRFDVRQVRGGGSMSSEPEPFSALPACSPGMLTGGDGLPLAQPPAGYPVAFPETGVLVDDPGHPQDLTAAVRAVFDVVFGADADRWWNEVAALLDPKGHYLGSWLAGNFFEHHLKRYSKSRRKAPIIWQLGTPSGRYSVWLYAHRLTSDSLFQLQNEMVGQKLTHEERQLEHLRQSAGGSSSASERKAIATQEDFVEELRAMLDDVKRIASLWNPNLDDGVVLTMAPLWRLVPQHKPWQRELRTKWEDLTAGKYDWAHLAMHLWPERVTPKCTNDRSLAIAHGLDDMFWVESADGKWKPRETPARPVDELVRERSSPAVKAALNGLLGAPTGSAKGRAGQRRLGHLTATDAGSP